MNRRPHLLPLLMASALVACGEPTESPSGAPVPSGGAPSAHSAGASPSESAAPPSGITWTDHAFDGLLSIVAVDGDRFVGVGGTEDGLAAWTSTDGIAWQSQEIPHPDFLAEYMQAFNAPAGPDDTNWLDAAGSSTYPATISSLVRLDDTLYAFGTFFGSNDFVRPVGWRLADGGEWQHIASQSAFFNECCTLFSVVADGAALVGVKHNFGDYSGEIWRWTPATSWVDVTPDVQPATGTSAAVFHDVIWSPGEGMFVAVGGLAAPDPSTAAFTWPASAASWTSSDGMNWETAGGIPAFAGAEMRSVVKLPGGEFLALGCSDCRTADPQPAAWTSVDGSVWSSVGTPGQLATVTELNDGLLAIEATDGSVDAWTSTDGTVWEDAGTFEGSLATFAANEERIVLALRTEATTGDPAETVIWLGTY